MPGDELFLRMEIVYARVAPDGRINAAVENGRMLLKVGGNSTDVTPEGGVPLLGGDGTEGCNGTNRFKSHLIPYSVGPSDGAMGRIPVVGIYTNGDAHLGEGMVGVVSATSTYNIPASYGPLSALTNCTVACFVASSTNRICLGATATFSVTATNGIPPYRFSWSGPGGFSATNETIVVSTAGVYTATVTDASDCVSSCEASLTAHPNPVCTIALSSTEVCPGECVDIEVRSSGGLPPYTVVMKGADKPSAITESNAIVRACATVLGTNLYTLDIIDANGCTTTCQAAVVAKDITPPTITCGASLIASESPRVSGSATVNFAAPAASDNCDTNPIVTCVPPSGSRFPVGETTVTCTASDDVGNTASCSFEVKVVPFVIIVVTSGADSGPGTLRQALNDANATPGLNLIRFQLPDVPVIRPLTPLPAVTEPVRIEGLPLGTSNAAPTVVLDGSLLQPDVGSYGLLLLAPSNVVRGLIINNFGTGIRVEGPGFNRIEANWIGVDATGLAAPNFANGISVKSARNIIGGPARESGNVISANGLNGIELEGANARGNIIVGNNIGAGANGFSPLGNRAAGIRLVDGAAGNVIGTTRSGEGNLVGFNLGSGAVLETSAGAGNRISGNNIAANGGIPIDLGADGVTPNDPLDADTGPNDYQNSPSVIAARSDTVSSTVVIGAFAGASDAVIDLEFYAFPVGEAAAFQQGLLFLGTRRVTTDASGNARFEFVFPSATFGHQFVVATATDAQNNTSEFSPPVKVQPPPVIEGAPPTTSSPPGGTAVLFAPVTGEGTLEYQWLLNGVIIPNATNELLNLDSLELPEGGTYTLTVRNEAGAVISQPGQVLIDFPQVQGSDLFAEKTPLRGQSGVISGNNNGASSEPGEPRHFGKPGGSSVWYTWTPPTTGIATFETVGSTFDTLLAVYTGSSVDALTEVAADEDTGGFLRSQLRFNAIKDVVYHIVVDGYGGATGRFVVRWDFLETEDLLPKILRQPVSVTAAPGGTAEFSVHAISGCVDAQRICRRDENDPPPEDPPPNERPTPESIILYYQWFFNGQPIPGATNTNYVVVGVQEHMVGQYAVQVSKFRRTTESRPASLQINLTGNEVQNVRAAAKFLDAASAPPIILGGVGGPPQLPPGLQVAQLAQSGGAIVRGYTGTQVFDASGGGAASIMCNVVGGNAVWVTFLPQDTGLLHLDTDGSSYNTVMEVFVYSATPGVLQKVDCDNNSGADGRDSSLDVPVQSGVTNFVVVGGVNGATGTLKLNYSLVTASLLISLGQTPQNQQQVRVTGRPDMRFTLEGSADFINWTPLITTNSASGVFDFIDTNSPGQPRRAYRALMLP